jgi:cytochrome P450
VDTLELRDAAFWQDPYPSIRRAREHHRFARSPGGELVLLAADDVDAANAAPELGQTGLLALSRLGVSDGPFRAWRALTMAAHDGEVHQRLRGAVMRSFTPKRTERLRDGAQRRAGRRAQALAERDVIDVVTDYAQDLPLSLICDFLGLELSAEQEIGQLLAGTEEMFTEPLTSDRRRHAEDGIVSLGGWVEELVEQRTRAPREDLVSDLVAAQAQGVLEYDELIALVVNVIGGAVGSSRAAIANSVYELLSHPEQTDRLRADRGRLPAAVEECLRFHPPFRLGRKLVLAPVGLFDQRLEAGQTVVLSLQAANRDPDRWPEPDRFDIARPVQRHYSFGLGAHFCLGQALARLNLQESVWAFLQALPDASLLTERPVRTPFTPDEQIQQLLVSTS